MVAARGWQKGKGSSTGMAVRERQQHGDGSKGKAAARGWQKGNTGMAERERQQHGDGSKGKAAAARGWQ